MTDVELAKVNKNRQEVSYKPGETIIKSGGPMTHILCLTRGKAKIYLESIESETRIILAIAKPVQLIGGPGFLVDARNHITVAALEETTICYIRVEDFTDVLHNNTEFSMELVKYLNQRILLHYDKILNITTKQTHGKIADTMLYLTDAVYQKDEFETNLSRQDIADMSAMTKESAIRVLKKFEKEGIVSCGAHSFKIKDKEALKKISKFG